MDELYGGPSVKSEHALPKEVAREVERAVTETCYLHERVVELERQASAPLRLVDSTHIAGVPIAERLNSQMARDLILLEVLHERENQDAEHGGGHHDDTHTGLDWCHMIISHAQRGEDAALTATEADGPALYGEARAAWRNQMLRVAALAVAAIESHDRRVLPEAA